MFKRFASAAMVASVLIAAASLALLTTSVPNPDGLAALMTLWCVLPVLWGVWAVLTPANWFPARLSAWGAVLGLVLGIVALFLLDIPGRLGFADLTTWWKGVTLPVVVAVYALFWLVVKRVHVRLSS